MNLLQRGAAMLAAVTLLSGCQLLRGTAPEPQPPAPPPVSEPLATHRFIIDPTQDEVIGELQTTQVQGEDTLSDIARRFNVGYEEIVRANPGVDPWLPGVGREIILPTQFVLPNAPREGLVINLPQLRVFYFPKPGKGEPQTVITHPIGIGKVGWSTPEGVTKVTSKHRNPTWHPPVSVRREHAKAGDPLPSKVPPGPDNPLGAHMMRLGWPSYLIHGTNKPYGVGLRSSHGCIRFYPEDIATLFDDIPVGTKVTVVNQPYVFGWRDGALYAQVFPVLEDDKRKHPKQAQQLLDKALSDQLWRRVKEHGASVDNALLDALLADPRGIAVAVSKDNMTLENALASARRVENRVPEGANWNGKDEALFTAEELEAARTGVIAPRNDAAPPAKKRANQSAGGAPSGSR